jgi:hypothetical protein
MTAMDPNVTSYTFHGNNCKPVYHWGLSYLPVPIPDQMYPDQAPQILADMRRNRVVPEGYSPYDDVGLMTQLFIYEQIAEHLDIGRSEPREAAALAALLHPNIARLAWPTRDELENYEEMLLFPWIYHTLITNSNERTARILSNQIGVTHFEAMDYLEAAKYYIQYIARFGRDIERPLMLSRVDGLVDRCLDDQMVTTALNGMKLKMQALGITSPGEELAEDRQTALSSGLREKIKKHEETKQLKEGTEQ